MLLKIILQAKFKLENEFCNKPSKSYILVAGRSTETFIFCSENQTTCIWEYCTNFQEDSGVRLSYFIFSLVYQQCLRVSSSSLNSIKLETENLKDWTVWTERTGQFVCTLISSLQCLLLWKYSKGFPVVNLVGGYKKLLASFSSKTNHLTSESAHVCKNYILWVQLRMHLRHR